MAKKIEQWFDNEGNECADELTALISDAVEASGFRVIEDSEEPDPLSEITIAVVAACDALHEYVHRNDAKTQAPEAVTDGPLFRHCGVVSGDDWAKRVERLNDIIDVLLDTPPCRPTLYEIKALREGDEVMISGSWFRVNRGGSGTSVCVRFKGDKTTGFYPEELATICQGIRRGE